MLHIQGERHLELVRSKTLSFSFTYRWYLPKDKISLSTKLDEKLEGANNFRAWKYRVMLILEEHDLEGFIENEVPEPEGDEAKARHKKSLIKAKRIIADSIKDHLIPHVSSLKTPKEMFDALSRLYEGKNINRKMTLRA